MIARFDGDNHSSKIRYKISIYDKIFELFLTNNYLVRICLHLQSKKCIAYQAIETDFLTN